MLGATTERGKKIQKPIKDDVNVRVFKVLANCIDCKWFARKQHFR